ncbi:MAG TPA: DinB family protein [Gemmatimonadaceae bacterium]
MSHQRHRRTYLVAAMLGVAAALPARVAHAQDVFDAKSAGHVRTEFVADMDTMHVKIIALAKAIPADKYSWRPGAGVRSVSEVLMHVVSEWYYWAPASMAGKPPAGFDAKTKPAALEKDVTTKEAVIAELEKSWAYCNTQIRTADASTLTGKYKPWGQNVDAAAFGMAGDLHEHLGQLIAYSRSVGVKPPWSK